MKILVYVDTSPGGDWALQAAGELASGLASSIILLTTEEALEKNPRLLEDAAARFATENRLEIISRVRPPPAREAILAESRESSPAIAIFPPGHRGRLATMLRGSRVKKVVHDSPATVMVARKPVSDHLRRILVTVSGGSFSETTLLSAQEITQAVHGTLSVLHVGSSVSLPARSEARLETPPDPRRELDAAFLALLDSLGLGNRLRTRQGLVVSEILAECEEGHYDLLVLGQHLADKEAGGNLAANIAEILALRCPIPVVVVRPRRWAAPRLPSSDR